MATATINLLDEASIDIGDQILSQTLISSLEGYISKRHWLSISKLFYYWESQIFGENSIY